MAISPDIVPEDSAPLPEWAARALSAVASRTVQHPPFESQRQSSAWPLLLDAAVVSTFLPRQLAPEAASGDERQQAENTVLHYSDPVTTPDSARWELRRDVRAAVLRLALGQDDFAQALARTSQSFGDAVSRALRDTLKGVVLKRLESADLPELEAMRAAASVLGDMESLLSLVPLPRLDRLIRKRRLVEQFERICGKDFRTEVVGRASELETLRGYVGVIAAESLLDGVVRGVASTRRAITGRKPLAFWGTGGVGKTTLLSRFMLEHIDSAQGSYPFAYLDFDRPSISPKDHLGLFAEICLQVSAQFEALDEPLRALRAEALEGQSSEPTSDADERVEQLVEALRNQVDHFLHEQESLFEWPRPFLIVLDTFEVVQYDANQVVHLERFLRLFVKSGWSRVRLILAGRKQVDKVGTEAEPLELEATELKGLDVDGASELLVRLAQRASRQLSAKAAAELAGLLAIKRNMLTKPKVHPLRIRMVGSIFLQREKETDEDVAQSLIKELQGGLKGGDSAARVLIDGILVRRIIDHVADPRVKALADPGLVVRHITPEVIERVMAPGTPRPGTEAEPDAADFEPWKVSPEEARDIYQAFSREITLVERDGPVLRHRQDVRSEMLPLIRARSPYRFEQLHRLAFEHFSQAAIAAGKADRPDELAAVEAVYHGLWCGEPLERLEGLWSRGQVSNARIDPEEFEPGSLAVLFLKARNREGLAADEARQLPPPIAGAWAIERGEQFLDATDPAAAFEVMQAAAGPRLEAVASDAPELLPVGARLLYRAGAWQDCATLTSYFLERSPLPFVRSPLLARAQLVRLLLHLNVKSGLHDLPPERALDDALAVLPAVAGIEIASHLLISQPNSSPDMLRDTIGRLQSTALLSSRRVLRLAILTSESARPDLVAAWVRSSDRFPSIQGGAKWRDKRLEALLAEKLQLGSASPSDDKERPWRQRRVEIATRVEDDWDLAAAVRYAMVFDHSDWQTALGNALTRAIALSRKGLVGHLKEIGFVPSRSSANGRAIVRAAVRDGRLLELAAALASLPGGAMYNFFPQEAALAQRFPQSLSDLGRALLAWHDRLGRMVGRNT
nr:hypothetical protein [uncultured Albidiferax sp.]